MTSDDATSTVLAHPDHRSMRLQMAKAGFLAGYRPVTRVSYADGLDQWLHWCARIGVDPLEVQRPHIELWGRYLDEERGLKPSTVAHRLVTVRSFYRYCEDEDIVAKSPANRVRLPKVSADSTTHGMTRQECILFMAAAERRPVQHALCCLLFLSGLRVSEACGANIEDLGFEGGHRTLTVTRKGNKRQTIPLPPKVVRVIEQAVGTRTAGPILLTAAGTRMTRRNAARTVDVIARRAKLPYHVHPHMGRHSFVTTALDAGAALNDVQDSAGHADPRTTMRYNRRRGQLDRNSSYLVTAFLATS